MWCYSFFFPIFSCSSGFKITQQKSGFIGLFILPLSVLHGLHHSYIFITVFIILCSQYSLYILYVVWQLSFLYHPSWYSPIFCICTSKDLQGICLFEGYTKLSNKLGWVGIFFFNCVGKKTLRWEKFLKKNKHGYWRAQSTWIFLVPNLWISST